MSVADTPLPPLFRENIAIFPGLAQALDTEPSVAIRYNPRKAHARPKCHVPWCIWGENLDHRPEFTFDPKMHQGVYYVQDASSMAIAAAVSDAASILGLRPLRVLDMCAAPGGKSTAALDALPPGSMLVSNEFDYRRAEILAENIAKWGCADVMVTRGDTSCLAKLESAFDIVIVDAPCSGEGMMRKDANARQQWSMSLVQQCSQLQREILQNAWRALSPCGILIYSTCTFNRCENDDNVDWLISEYGAASIDLPQLDANSEHIMLSSTPGKGARCYRFLPGRVDGEGLFMAALAKHGTPQPMRPSKSKSAFVKAPSHIASAVKQWLDQSDNYDVMMRDDTAYAVPRAHAAFMLAVAAQADTLAIGTAAAYVKGRDVLPTQQLALSTCLNRSVFPQVDVDADSAISYLQRQVMHVDAPRGIVLLNYCHRPLGFVKNLGTRANNLYPKNWRIISGK